MRLAVLAALTLTVSDRSAAAQPNKNLLGSYKIVERQSQGRSRSEGSLLAVDSAEQSSHPLTSMFAAESPLEAKLEIQQGVQKDLGHDVNPLKLLVNATQPDTLHFKLSPLVQGRWEIPAALFKRPTGSWPVQSWCSRCLVHNEADAMSTANASGGTSSEH